MILQIKLSSSNDSLDHSKVSIVYSSSKYYLFVHILKVKYVEFGRNIAFTFITKSKRWTKEDSKSYLWWN